MKTYIVKGFIRRTRTGPKIEKKDANGNTLYLKTSDGFVTAYEPVQTLVTNLADFRKRVDAYNEKDLRGQLSIWAAAKDGVSWGGWTLAHTLKIKKISEVQSTEDMIDNSWSDNGNGTVSFTCWDTALVTGVGRGGRLATAGFNHRKCRTKCGYKYWEVTVDVYVYKKWLKAAIDGGYFPWGDPAHNWGEIPAGTMATIQYVYSKL
jgi:hypothetical protein